MVTRKIGHNQAKWGGVNFVKKNMSDVRFWWSKENFVKQFIRRQIHCGVKKILLRKMKFWKSVAKAKYFGWVFILF